MIEGTASVYIIKLRLGLRKFEVEQENLASILIISHIHMYSHLLCFSGIMSSNNILAGEGWGEAL